MNSEALTAEMGALRQEFGQHVGNSDQRHTSHEARIKVLESMEGKFDNFLSTFDTNVAWLKRIASLIGVVLTGVAGMVIKIFIEK